MKNRIFNKGDKVFDFKYGWGYVDNDYAVTSMSCPISVTFEQGYHISYTEDGREHFGVSKSLSFTEYTLQRFTQERPEVLPNKGDIVWVKDKQEQRWWITHFLRKQDDMFITSDSNSDINCLGWKFLTTENPYKNERN